MAQYPITIPAQKCLIPPLPLYYCPWPMAFSAPVVVPTIVPVQEEQQSAIAVMQQPSAPVKKYKRTWSREQIEELYSQAKEYCLRQGREMEQLDITDFSEIGRAVCRSPRKCMNKLMEIQVSGTLRSGVWGSEEDGLLKKMLLDQKKKWGAIANAINTAFHKGVKVRTGKQCKERWNNHINPLIERGGWSEAEDLKLLECYLRLGNRWSLIAKEIANRTDSSIKNRIKSLLNRERQDVLTTDTADLLESLIQRKRAAVMEQSASPASCKPSDLPTKSSFSAAVASLPGLNFDQLTKIA